MTIQPGSRLSGKLAVATGARMGLGVALLCALAYVAPSEARAQSGVDSDWPQFRGPNRDGIVPHPPHLRSDWSETPPKVVWRRPIGEGFSSISVAGGRLFTFYAVEGQEYAAAFEAATGEELWRQPLGAVFEGEWGNGPRSTPTVENGWVYVLGSHGRLMALSEADGTTRWQLDIREQFPGKGPRYGFSPAPLIDGSQLVLEVGGEGGKSIAGFDKATGELRWTVHEDSMGYCSPVAVEIAGQHQLVFATPNHIVGVSATGDLLWRRTLTGVTGLEFPTGMPVAVPPDRVFVSHRAGGGSVLLRPHWRGEGFALEEVWESRFMINHWSSTLFLDGYLYGFHNATLKCLSVETGRQVWAKRGLGKGSLIAVADLLLILSDRGRLLLVDATPEAYRERGRIQALGLSQSWTAPTLVGNRVYLRNHEEMLCLELPVVNRGAGEE